MPSIVPGVPMMPTFPCALNVLHDSKKSPTTYHMNTSDYLRTKCNNPLEMKRNIMFRLKCVNLQYISYQHIQFSQFSYIWHSRLTFLNELTCPEIGCIKPVPSQYRSLKQFITAGRNRYEINSAHIKYSATFWKSLQFVHQSSDSTQYQNFGVSPS